MGEVSQRISLVAGAREQAWLAPRSHGDTSQGVSPFCPASTARAGSEGGIIGSMKEGLGSGTDDPGSRVVEQPIRNRIIEYLELASSFEDQRLCAENAPIVNVAYEIVNQWEDWVHCDPRSDSAQLGVYDDAEIEAMKRFHAVWEQAVAALPDAYPSISAVQELPAWIRLREHAQSALAVFLRRGTMPDDRELGRT